MSSVNQQPVITASIEKLQMHSNTFAQQFFLVLDKYWICVHMNIFKWTIVFYSNPPPPPPKKVSNALILKNGDVY